MKPAKPTIETLVGGIPRSLGSYGPIILELEAVTSDPQSSLLEMGAVVEKDTDLTLRLLKLGNGSFYGFPTRLETVAEAIGLIGFVEVQDLLVAASVIEAFAGVPQEFVNMESFWRHSLACGVGARVLAIARRLPKPEKYFVAGLVHDLGRLVLYSQAPECAREVFDCYHSEPQLLRQAELKVLTFDHAQIAEALLRKWQYPARLVEAVAWHHQPLAAGSQNPGAAVVHLADHLVNALQLGSSGERFVPPLQLKAWQHLGLPSYILESVMEAIEDQIEAVQAVFLALRPGVSQR